MGTEGRKIIKMDLNELIKELNKAIADEWLAYYQYWLGAKLAKGPMRKSVVAELSEHAADELRHADMLAKRINQLGGAPVLSPQDQYKVTNCGYEEPSDPRVKALLNQNIKAEQCAIDTYQNLINLVKEKDEITYQMLLKILADEIEHEDELEALVEDMELI